MKPLFFPLSGLLLALPLLASAQTEPKAAPKKPAATKPAPKAKPSASRTDIKSQANQMAAGIHAAEVALTPAELAIAERVQTGHLPCELGASVTLTRDPQSPGYFDLRLKNLKYRMAPVPTSTGAIRLEDAHAGAVWLQLANKSMLMNQKLGARLADECQSPQQMDVAAALQRNPAQSLLDVPTPAAAPAVPGPQTNPAGTTR